MHRFGCCLSFFRTPKTISGAARRSSRGFRSESRPRFALVVGGLTNAIEEHKELVELACARAIRTIEALAWSGVELFRRERTRAHQGARDSSLRGCGHRRGPTSRVVDADNEAARYRFEVTTPRAASLKVEGFVRSSDAGRADEPLSVLAAANANDGRRWTVEFVVQDGLGITSYLSGEMLDVHGSGYSIRKTIDPLEPRP